MSTLSTTRHVSPLPASPVEYNFSSLAHHMGQCRSAQGRWFEVRAGFEALLTVMSPRLVTCGAFVSLCAFALLSLA